MDGDAYSKAMVQHVKHRDAGDHIFHVYDFANSPLL